MKLFKKIAVRMALAMVLLGLPQTVLATASNSGSEPVNDTQLDSLLSVLENLVGNVSGSGLENLVGLVGLSGCL